ncbi:hypothetical protein GCM10010987_18730 [Bradyrhizobium guangdongense]|uniref:Uncharacterized protein n=1 Tax=Bradyrhizobium guangdongense TaxID=1325090 RepID=A0AA87W1R9_9BRAD|nr:hypothetical protein GCM10010987_18730 [Bradyrhizobium guangdongense]
MIAEIGRRVGRMDGASGTVDRRMTYQPEEGLAFHADLPGKLAAVAYRRVWHIDSVFAVILDARDGFPERG